MPYDEDAKPYGKKAIHSRRPYGDDYRRSSFDYERSP
jgi:hypothetical protein